MRRTEIGFRDAEAPGDIQAWMAQRWADLERRGEPASSKLDRVSLTEPEPLQQLLSVEPEAGPDRSSPNPMDLGLRFQPVRHGDSISKLIGSSDPAAIGKFLSLNGMDGRDSTLRAGRSYIVPTRWDDASSDEESTGEALLAADNTRLRELAERRAAEGRQAALLLDGRNIWTGEPVATPRRARSPRPQAQRSHHGGLDDNATAKAAAGALGWGLGILPGAVRGGLNTVKGAGEGAYFVYELTRPYPQGQLAREQLLDAGRSAAGYVMRGIEDPSVVQDDIAEALHDFD